MVIGIVIVTMINLLIVAIVAINRRAIKYVRRNWTTCRNNDKLTN